MRPLGSRGYRRWLQTFVPAIETEFAAQSKEKADEEAIHVFAENLRQLLLGAPLGQKRVLGIDPGFRTGCKVVCLDAQGNLLHHDVIMPHPPVNKRTEAAITLQRLTFSKTSLNVREFTVHVLLKPGLENFEHYFTCM